MSLGSNRCCSLPTNTNVVGPQGANGPYGSIGQIGITGSTGSIGVTGATGLCYRGYKGPQGLQGGSTGNTGPPGPQGASGSTAGINRYFNFTTGSTASYGNTGFTDLTGFTTTFITNSVLLSAGIYSINWEILEGWTDTENQFYVRLNKTIDYYPNVFNAISPCVLYSNSTQITGIGNDVITIVDPGIHSIELLQSTKSTNIIQIGTKPINFSITFVLIS
jgi:hypothetical protein